MQSASGRSRGLRRPACDSARGPPGELKLSTGDQGPVAVSRPVRPGPRAAPRAAPRRIVHSTMINADLSIYDLVTLRTGGGKALTARDAGHRTVLECQMPVRSV